MALVTAAASGWVALATSDTRSPSETVELARVVAAFLEQGDVVLLEGDLGAGKTLFTRAVCAELGVADGVSSPSYGLVHRHDEGRVPIAHVDLYRLTVDDEELESVGIRDVFDGELLVLVEWPERAPWLADVASVHVHLEDLAPQRRRVTVSVPREHAPARADLAAALTRRGR